LSIVSARSTFLYSFRNVNATSKRATRSPENRIGSVCCREDGGGVNDDDDPWRSSDDDDDDDDEEEEGEEGEEDADAAVAADDSSVEPALPIFPARVNTATRVHAARRHADADTDADADTTPVRRYPRCPPDHPSAPRDGDGLNANEFVFLRGIPTTTAVGPSFRTLIRTLRQDRSQAQCKGPPIDR
jgi:hypothetical protein